MASRTYVNPVLSRIGMDLLLDSLIPSGTPTAIVAPKLALIIPDAVVLTPDTTKAELDAIEVAFSGYTTGGVALTMLTAPVNAGTNRLGLVGNGTWVAVTATPFVSANIGGWYLYDTTYGLLAAELFGQANNVQIAQVGDYLDLFAGLVINLYA